MSGKNHAVRLATGYPTHHSVQFLPDSLFSLHIRRRANKKRTEEGRTYVFSSSSVLPIQQKNKAGNKPGSVYDDHLSTPLVAKGLQQPTRRFWTDYPTCCLVLLLTRLTLPPLLPVVRWALTPPFHPYRLAGGIFSVVLSIALPLPGVTRRHVLWSPDFPHAARRPPAII